VIVTMLASVVRQTGTVAVTMSYEPTLDHLVYGAPDLAAAVDAVHALTGVRPVEGGRHLGLGT
jgi:hypothetical protein